MILLLIPELIYYQKKFLGLVLKKNSIRNHIEFHLDKPPMCCFINEYTVYTAQKYTFLSGVPGVVNLLNRCIELFKTTGRIKDEKSGFSAYTVTE